MKVKLKSGEKLSSNNSYQGLTMEQWTSLNQGKEIEVSSMPERCKDQLEISKVKGAK